MSDPFVVIGTFRAFFRSLPRVLAAIAKGFFRMYLSAGLMGRALLTMGAIPVVVLGSSYFDFGARESEIVNTALLTLLLLYLIAWIVPTKRR